MQLFETMGNADFVVVDGVLFETAYLRVPDADTQADDVVVEARHGEREIDFTRCEFDDAQALPDGLFRLKSGSLVRFLTGAVLH